MVGGTAFYWPQLTGHKEEGESMRSTGGLHVEAAWLWNTTVKIRQHREKQRRKVLEGHQILAATLRNGVLACQQLVSQQHQSGDATLWRNTHNSSNLVWRKAARMWTKPKSGRGRGLFKTLNTTSPPGSPLKRKWHSVWQPSRRSNKEWWLRHQEGNLQAEPRRRRWRLQGSKLHWSAPHVCFDALISCRFQIWQDTDECTRYRIRLLPSPHCWRIYFTFIALWQNPLPF